jgi:hypothetical protein
MDDITGFGAMCKAGADVLIRLIDALEKATGWVATQYLQRPSKQAQAFMIQSIKDNTHYSDFEKAVLISNVKILLKQHTNQEIIVKFAAQFMAPTAKPETVNPDWLSVFMDYAKNVSIEEMQLVWGKLLATEVSDPGTVPQKVMYILATLDPDTARDFNTLLSNSLVTSEGNYIPIVQHSHDAVLDTENMEELVSAGLVYLQSFLGFGVDLPSRTLSYFDTVIRIDDDHIRNGCMLLSKCGQTLAHIIKVEKDDQFIERCVKILQKEDYKVTISHNPV